MSLARSCRSVIGSTAVASLFAGLLACLPAGSPLAGGFSINEGSASNIGNAFAGGASAEDPTTIIHNPAGMVRLEGTQAGVTVAVLDYSAEFTDRGSTSPAGSPSAGGDGGNAGVTALIPSIFVTTALSPEVSVGLGVYTPFGLETKYDADWKGRYQAIKSQLHTYNLNPSIAVRVTRKLSVGLGADILRADATLTRAIDFGALCFVRVNPTTCTNAGVLPQGADGTVRVKGEDWAAGLNVGALYEFSPALRAGVTYRSRIKEKLTGRATFSNPSLPGGLAALTTTPATTDTDVEADVDLPDSVAANVFWQINPQWALLADITWTHWSLLESLHIQFANGVPDSVDTFNWHNTVREAIAVNYQLNSAWKLRLGFANDPGTVDARDRGAILPDSGRYVIGAGANWRITERDSVDLAYSHLFFAGAPINSVVPGAGAVNGSYDNSTDIVAVQYQHRF